MFVQFLTLQHYKHLLLILFPFKTQFTQPHSLVLYILESCIEQPMPSVLRYATNCQETTTRDVSIDWKFGWIIPLQSKNET